MRPMLVLVVLLSLIVGLSVKGEEAMLEQDTFQTSQGDLVITFIGHATLMFQFNGKVIHVDPVSREGDYSQLPQADLILVTHDHFDHFEPKLIEKLRKATTDVVLTKKCREKVKGTVLPNGEKRLFQGIQVESVPAYNMVHMRSPGKPFHPKGEGNGYVLTFGKLRVYVAGDAENTPEMKALKEIDVAFLPMNLPYTMTPEMVADAAKAFRPKVLYPYHYGDTDPKKLVALLKDEPGIEVRIRKMK